MFQGELMICIMSGEQLQNDPNVESGWARITFNGKTYYVSAKWRDESYRKIGHKSTWLSVLKKVIELDKGGA